MIPRIAIVGHRNSGKTTLVERLITVFTEDGLRVAAIKHTSDERGFDKPETDSDRLMRAGAVGVGMVAKTEIGFYTTRTTGASERWIEAAFTTLPFRPDLIIYEGYRAGWYPRIECILDPALTRPTVEHGLVAVVSDHAVTAAVPVLAYDPLEPIVSAIKQSFRPCGWPTGRP